MFSCGMWDIEPQSGIELRPPALGVWSVSHWTTREIPEIFKLSSAEMEKAVDREVIERLEIKWRRKWQPTPVFLPGKSHGRWSLVGCSPWGREESDTTEQLHFHFSLLCIGEENGNPLHYSCLENARDRGAWWAAVYWVAQVWTWLKRLSSSSSGDQNVCFWTYWIWNHLLDI